MENAVHPCPRDIELIALDPARNIRRRYHIHLSIDLFGQFLVDYGWGRIGTRGQSRKLSFPNLSSAEHHIGRLLTRRGTAEKRLGVPYKLAEACSPE